MKRKIIGILVMMLLITTTVLPVLGVSIDLNKKKTQPANYYELELEMDTNNPSNTVAISDTYEIYEGQYFKLTLTGRWNPPNPTKTICLWANAATIPAGATLTPPCNCAPGEVTSVFEWTPAVGQAGTYFIDFYLGEFCGVPLLWFQITIIVHPSGQDDPPVVIILSPADGITVSSSTLTVIGYATDDIGVASFGRQHEWTGDQQITSGTLPPPYQTYYPFEEVFTLRLGWNRITIFVSDTKGQGGQDQIVVYYVTNQPPNKPTTPTGPSSGKTGSSLHFESTFTDPDADSMEVFFDWGDGNNTGWIGPVASGSTIGNYYTYAIDGTYDVKTKSRDLPHLEESVWSDPHSVTTPRNKEKEDPKPFGFILAFGTSVDVKIVQLEPGEDYVDLEILNKAFYIWDQEMITFNPGVFLRLYEAKGLFTPYLPFCIGICSDYGIIG